MARKRRPIQFKVDRNLEVAVENAAFGLTITGRQTRTRKRRTTLEAISEEIADEAKKIAKEMPARTRRSDGGLAKSAPRHPFDRSNPSRSTYIKSIEALPVTRVRGRMSISITAKHSNADDVEYGSAGGVVKKVRAKGKRFTIPIHGWKYDQLQKSRNMSLKQRRAKGWPSASKEQRKIYSDLSNAKRSARSKSKRNLGLDSRMRAARRAKDALAARDRLSAKAGRARVIPMRGESGRFYIAVSSFETYNEYAILRRAMNRIAISKFE
jgi:hypothetical protein